MEQVFRQLQRPHKYWVCILALLVVHGCSIVPPRTQGALQDTRNICSIFRENPKWYFASKRAEKRWGIPVHVQMAIMRQESHFEADARPPREMLFGVIPGERPSTAYGYAQALDGTWEEYQSDTGNIGADRDEFKDATDFMGWYAYKARQKAGIRSTDAYHLYLAYHDGINGYLKGTYRSKGWLVSVAKKVQRTSIQYKAQLRQCTPHLKKSRT